MNNNMALCLERCNIHVLLFRRLVIHGQLYYKFEAGTTQATNIRPVVVDVTAELQFGVISTYRARAVVSLVALELLSSREHRSLVELELLSSREHRFLYKLIRRELLNLFFFNSWRSGTSSLGTEAIYWTTVPALDNI
jgi:hypothetical protein